ncbi:MAG: aminopeptidase [Anaerolineales bacterium]
MNELEFSQSLQKYADVVVRIGLNLRAGQRLMISAGIFDYPLVRKVISSAYNAGARYVDVLWNDEECAHIHLNQAPQDGLTEIPNWLPASAMEYIENGDAYLGIASANPDAFADVDPERVQARQIAMLQKMEKANDAIMHDAINWCVVSSPTKDWASKIFPSIPGEQAVEKLWEAIFQTCRVDQPDPVAAWLTHIADLKKRSEYMNTKRYSALHYQAPGTDLTVGLPEKHVWLAAQMKAENGIDFTANMPTEEIFTLPHKDRVDGTVCASRPLVVNGRVVEDFTLTFQNGKITHFTAQKEEETLRKLIETDEGSKSIGEVALVPNSSPISRRGHLFFNTLFDENAASHIAIGRAYRFTMDGGNEMTEEEFQANGGNFSLTHNDFMIGSKRMDIDGITTDGRREPVMRSGEWAFEA